MLPDGSINSGEMTSFNHYALGAVADWMHRVIGGLSPLAPGYSHILIAPQPGGDLSWANSSLETPHGEVRVNWRLEKNTIRISGTVPNNNTAILRLHGHSDRELEPGAFEINAIVPTGAVA